MDAVLLTDQPGPVPCRAEHVNEMALRMGEPISPMGQAEHPRDMRRLSGQQRGARARADRGGAKRLPEDHSLVGQMLDVRGRHCKRYG